MKKTLTTILACSAITLLSATPVIIPTTASASNVINGMSPNRFPSNAISIYVSPEFGTKENNQINQAINIWNQTGMINLTPSPNKNSQIVIKAGKKNLAKMTVNNNNNYIKQSVITLNPNNQKLAIAAKNEIGYSIGLNLKNSKHLKLSHHDTTVLHHMYIENSHQNQVVDN